MVDPNKPNIEAAAMAVREANMELAKAMDASMAASRRETEARNRANDAQKAFDKVVAEFKGSAIRGTDWASRKHQKEGMSDD